MTSYIQHNAALSVLTLGFLNATGWYEVDFSLANHYREGYASGCGYFQSVQSQNSCSYDADQGDLKYQCSEDYRFFTKCQQFSASTNISIPQIDGDCFSPQQNYHHVIQHQTGETFSHQSRCFLSNLLFPESQDTQKLQFNHSALFDQRCLRSYCQSSQDGELSIIIILPREQVSCLKSHSKIYVNEGKNYIACPSIQKFCLYAADKNSPSRSCSERGYLKNRACVCEFGFIDSSCKTICQD